MQCLTSSLYIILYIYIILYNIEHVLSKVVSFLRPAL